MLSLFYLYHIFGCFHISRFLSVMFTPHRRQMPLENRPGSAEVAPKDYNDTPSWEKGADCTPTNKSTFMISCPPAPNRNLCSTLVRSDSSSSDESRDSDDCDLLGIRPIDTSMRVGANESPMKSPKTKKRRLDNSIVHEELSDDSTHSSLKYLKTVGTVAPNRQDPEKLPDERGCIMCLSYRQRRDNPNDVQISLIVYKPNAKNVKSRRNLLSEFGETSSTVTDEHSQTPIGKSAKTMLTTPSKSGGKNDHIRPSPSSSKKRQLNTLRF